MTPEQKPHQLLFQICIYLNSHNDITIPCPSRGENWHSKGWTLISSFKKSPSMVRFNLTDEEVIILAEIWFLVVQVEHKYFTAHEILTKVISAEKYIDHLGIIIGLLEKQVLYTSKKKIIHSVEVNEPTKRIRYTKRSLLEEHISLHHDFVSILVGEPEEIDQEVDRPYKSNKEYLTDWFAYTSRLHDLHYCDFSEIRFDEELSEIASEALMEILRWKHRISSRMELTDEIFPLLDIVEEYSLDENETTMFIHLVKAELDGNTVDTDELLKLVSIDQHELFQNREYFTVDARLVRNGIIELSENMFLKSLGSEVRTTPDIMKQIILDTPVNDDERLAQILKGDDIFTLIDPNYSMDDLILSSELKQTIITSISRYNQNVGTVLEDWQLYDGVMEVVGRIKKKTEPGLLVLLHGPSGTGKTFASGAIAKHLGKKLLITDISRLQSMWIGESEKNIRRLFNVFERIVRRIENPPVLLLNEADQFLTTRLNDARTSIDQMQNSMQNLFLEGFERMQGVMIATTNFQENIDSAFSRRFHLKLELPMPELAEREKLWKLHLPPSIPRAPDVDIESLAVVYKLSGGQIKIIVQNAATEAASRSRKYRILKQGDLEKYCLLEQDIFRSNRMSPIGFS